MVELNIICPSVVTNLLSIKGGDSFRDLEFKVVIVPKAEDTGSAFEDEDREIFPLDNDNLALERAYEDIDIDEPTPRSDAAEFRNDDE